MLVLSKLCVNANRYNSVLSAEKPLDKSYLISSFLCGYTVAKQGEGNIIKCGLLPGIIFGFIISLFALAIKIEDFTMNESFRILLISAAGSTMGGVLKLCNSNK